MQGSAGVGFADAGAGMTTISADHDVHGSPPVQHGTARRLLLGAGWIRAAWMTVFFAAIGLGIVEVLRWWGNWQPIWDWQPIVLVSFFVAAPFGFLAGLWTLYFWASHTLG